MARPRHLWQYAELHAPLWLMTLDSTRSLLLNGPFELSATDILLARRRIKEAQKHLTLGNSNLEEGSSKKFE
eukprot:scaffold24758_cov136-Skeletonema_dohrnii-CCMP3373.AAC.1